MYVSPKQMLFSLNHFLPLFLKTSENLWIFRGDQKGTLGRKGLTNTKIQNYRVKIHNRHHLFDNDIYLQTFTCSMSTIETLEKGKKYVQS